MLRFAAMLLLLCTSAALRAQTVVCFGDSLTAGEGAPSGSAYPDFLRRDLARAGYHATIINQGVPGDTTKEALARFQKVLGAHPSVVILELGINDALFNRPVSETSENLTSMIDSMQRAHIRILLAGMDLTPMLGPNLPPQLEAESLKSFYVLYPALAKKYNLPLIPFLLQGVYGVPGMMSPDYIHPNAAGYEKVADTVLPNLEKMLDK